MAGLRRVAALPHICAAVFALSLCAHAQDAPPSPETAARDAGPRALSLSVTVTDDRNLFVDGLKQEAFFVFDGGQQARVVSFGDEDAPASVHILLDASGSMSGERNETAGAATVRNAVLRFLRGSHAASEFSLTAFNRSPQLLLDRSSDPAAVLAALDLFASAKLRGPTALYDSLYLTLNKAASDGKHRRRVVLLFTDGGDSVSSYTYGAVKRAVAEADVMLYVVAPLHPVLRNYEGHVPVKALSELAGLSGGRAFFPQSAEEVYDAVESVALELRTQYTVGFIPAPSGGKDGWHPVKVKMGEVRDPGGKKMKLRARTRSGFYDSPSNR